MQSLIISTFTPYFLKPFVKGGIFRYHEVLGKVKSFNGIDEFIHETRRKQGVLIVLFIMEVSNPV